MGWGPLQCEGSGGGGTGKDSSLQSNTMADGPKAARGGGSPNTKGVQFTPGCSAPSTMPAMQQGRHEPLLS